MQDETTSGPACELDGLHRTLLELLLTDEAPGLWSSEELVVWAAAVIVGGGHVRLETPAIHQGRYVTTRYGDVVRQISPSEYRNLQMGRLRLFGGFAVFFAAFGAALGVSVRSERA